MGVELTDDRSPKNKIFKMESYQYDALWFLTIFFCSNPLFELREFSFHNICLNIADRIQISRHQNSNHSNSNPRRRSHLPIPLERLLLKSIVTILIYSNLIPIYLFFRPNKFNSDHA